MHEEYWNSKYYSGNCHERQNIFIDYLALLLWDQNEDLVYIGLPTHFCFFVFLKLVIVPLFAL